MEKYLDWLDSSVLKDPPTGGFHVTQGSLIITQVKNKIATIQYIETRNWNIVEE